MIHRQRPPNRTVFRRLCRRTSYPLADEAVPPWPSQDEYRGLESPAEIALRHEQEGALTKTAERRREDAEVRRAEYEAEEVKQRASLAKYRAADEPRQLDRQHWTHVTFLVLTVTMTAVSAGVVVIGVFILPAKILVGAGSFSGVATAAASFGLLRAWKQRPGKDSSRLG